MALCSHRGRTPAAPRPALAAGPGSTASTGRGAPSDEEVRDRYAPPGAGRRGPTWKAVRLPDGLDTLADLTTNQLCKRWSELGIRGDRPSFKQALVRGIAWHLQKQAKGGLDAETRRLLKAAIRNAPSQAVTHRDIPRRKQRDSVQLRTGTTLVRMWRGRTHEVSVLDGGKRFRYRDTEYTSLSEIAREITGARWSGPRFFGLKKLKGTA